MGNLAIREVPTVGSLPQGWVENLDFALNWRVNPDHLYMAMVGYFDESGTHGAQSPVVIVGGFLATVEQWAAYERDLTSLMAEFGVRKFHAKDFRQTKGDFKGWLRNKKAQFNSHFLQLADQHLAFGVSTVLSSDAYRQIYAAGNVRRGARRDTQYGLCIRCALWKTMTLMKDRRDDWPVNFIFELGHKHAGDATRVFTEVRGGLRPDYSSMFGSMTFDTKEALPLAVADSLSYAIFRLSAGFSHSTQPDAAVTGEADPPYYVHKIPLARTVIDEATLAALRDDLAA
jgi:hypothetical protein